MKHPRTSRWKCSECSQWYPYPYPGPLRIDATTPPWVCHYCERNTTDAIARRILEAVWTSSS